MPYWRWVVLAFAGVALSAAMDFIVPKLLARAIDEGIDGGDARHLGVLAGLVVGLIIVRGASQFAFRWAVRTYESRIAHRLRQDLYNHLQRLHFGYYDRVDSGDVITRAISDTNAVRMFAGNGFIDIVHVLVIFAVILSGMASESGLLTLLSVGVLALMAITAGAWSLRVRPMWLATQQQQAVATKALSENLNGIRVVKAFAEEPHEIDAFRREAESLRERSVRPVRELAKFMPAMIALTGVGTVLVLWVGGRMAIEGALSVGVLVGFYYYFARLVPPTRRLGMIMARIARAVASGERLFELLDTPVRVASNPNPRAPQTPGGNIRFDAASLAYGRRPPALHEITADVRAGSTIGIVGPTGSGKTSIANLIPRFYDATGGAVLVDGTDVRDLDLHELRKKAAIVAQDPFLFSDSVRNNIAYGDPDASIERVVAAARDAQAYNFITNLPEGFETVVGERGLGLSGGQRQRLTIARALLLDAPVLILDDATSSVDAETERRLQAALQARAAGRTTFVVSQRIGSVQNADAILVLDGGRVIDRGTHEELIGRPGFYRDTYELQTHPEAAGAVDEADSVEVAEAGEA